MTKNIFKNLKFSIDNYRNILYNIKKWIVIVSVQARPVYTKIKINVFVYLSVFV